MFNTLDSENPVRQMAAAALWSHHVCGRLLLNQFELQKMVRLEKCKYLKSVQGLDRNRRFEILLTFKILRF